MTPKEYEHCVHQYADRLYRFALKQTGNAVDAKDMVQNAFEVLWKNHKNIATHKARAYLFSVAHHKTIDQQRKLKRMSWVAELPEYGHQNIHQQTELKMLLEESLKVLSDIQRSVLLLRDYEGYSYKEIAELTKLSESQVKVYIFRARKKLKTQLTDLT